MPKYTTKQNISLVIWPAYSRYFSVTVDRYCILISDNTLIDVNIEFHCLEMMQTGNIEHELTYPWYVHMLSENAILP